MDELAVVSRARAGADGRGVAMHVWDIRSGASIGCFKGAVVARGALCAGRDLVAAAQDDKAAITVWRWNTDNPLIKMPIMERITALALTPDGRLCLAGGINGGLYGWEITTGRMVICVRSAHYRKINAIVVFDDSALCATAGDDALVRVWSLLSLRGATDSAAEAAVNGASAQPVWSLQRHSLPVTSLCCSRGLADAGRLYSGGKDRQCFIWEVATGQLLGAIALSSDITALAIDPAEVNLFLGTGAGTIFRVVLHDVSLEQTSSGWAARPKQQLTAHTAAIQEMRITMDGRYLVTVALDGQLRLWDTTSLQVMKFWTDEPLNNVVLIPRVYLDLPSQNLAPVAQFARQAHVAGDIVQDAQARDQTTHFSSLQSAVPESSEERRRAAKSRLSAAHTTAGVSHEMSKGLAHENRTVAPDSALTGAAGGSEPTDQSDKRSKLEQEVAAWRLAAVALLQHHGEDVIGDLEVEVTGEQKDDASASAAPLPGSTGSGKKKKRRGK